MHRHTFRECLGYLAGTPIPALLECSANHYERRHSSPPNTHMRNACNFIQNGFSYFSHGRIPHIVSATPWMSPYPSTDVFDTLTTSLPTKANQPCQRPSKLLGCERRKYHEIVQLVVPCIVLFPSIFLSLVGCFIALHESQETYI